jgi:hypothetical protein
MSKGNERDKKRRRLYDLYVANFGLYHAPAPDLFVCPVCLMGFGRWALDKPLSVDLAHVYPEAAGGRAVTLTCKGCNGRIGGKYDDQIVREHRGYDAFNPQVGGAYPVRLYTKDGTSVGMSVTTTPAGQLLFNEIPQQTDERARQAYIAAFMSGGHDTFKMVARWLDPRRHDVAILHAAHLCLFRLFGYEYLLYAHTERTREILTRDEPPEGPLIITAAIPSSAGLAAAAVLGAAVVQVSDYGRCLAAFLPTPEPGMAARVVLLPGFGKHAPAEYEKVRQLIPGHLTFKFDVWYGQPELFLHDQRSKFMGHRMFRRVRTH